MGKNLFITTLILIAAINAAGCASKQPEPRTDPAIDQLNKAAVSIQGDLEKLSRIKQAGFKKVKLFESPEEGPMTKKVTLKWSGPVSDVLEIIAASIDYEFKIRGKAPASPVLVNVDKIKVPAFELLEDLGWKIGKHQISVDAGKEIIQLTYFEGPLTEGISEARR